MEKNIILIGMPSSGKTTLGRPLARRLGYSFLDTDEVIKERNGCSLQDIIDRDGLEAFRLREREAVCSVAGEKTVIATGGSVIYDEPTMAHLRALGTVVYLHISFPMLEKRIGDPRVRGVAIPEGFTFRDLYDQRVPLYEKYADKRVNQDPTDSTKDSLERLLAVLK